MTVKENKIYLKPLSINLNAPFWRICKKLLVLGVLILVCYVMTSWWKWSDEYCEAALTRYLNR